MADTERDAVLAWVAGQLRWERRLRELEAALPERLRGLTEENENVPFAPGAAHETVEFPGSVRKEAVARAP